MWKNIKSLIIRAEVLIDQITDVAKYEKFEKQMMYANAIKTLKELIEFLNTFMFETA